MKIIVAPNSFKGSLSASQAAAAIARGVREAVPTAQVVEIPVADGGEGTVEALVSARKGAFRSAQVTGPLGDPVQAVFGQIEGGRVGVVELASAGGLTLIPPERRDPRRASTYGFGQLLEAVRHQGVSSIIAGIGGSATNDGGAGMAEALGYRFLDARGRELPRGGAALVYLDRIDGSRLDPAWRSIKVMVASDVTNPLTGPEGASFVYGPQKGADAEAVRELDRALARLAEVIERDLGKMVSDLPGAGAAGGTGAGLIAFLGARLVPGAPLVVDASGFDQALPGAWLVITGEGRVDGQTAYGKAPGEVARRAQAAGIPTLLLAGSRGPGWESLSSMGVTSITTLDSEGHPEMHNLQVLMHHAAPELTRAAARAVQEML
ncbi:MAG TPA: glycerate kinase [Candidatus Dormibacteraeota bacterium]|nr:glycerate kinase [Candidatus Dormibacteraeota bacterium]